MKTSLYTSVVGADAQSNTAPPLDLAIVINSSGSMKGERLANAIAAAVGTVDRIHKSDTVTVVSFDTQAQVVVAPTRVNAGSRPGIEAAIR